MLPKLSLLALLLAVVLPASAGGRPGAIAGYVRNSSGVPQMGAAVEIASGSRTIRVFTNEKGFYSYAGLLPGVYRVKVSAPSFLPALREKVGLRSGASAVVNFTLNTLFEALQIAPRRGAGDDEDDWKWTLRSAANRPILRALPDGSPVMIIGSEKNDRDMKGSLSFLAGSPSQGYRGASDMSTGFSVEHSVFSSGTLSLLGNMGYGSGLPTAVFRTTYSHRLPNGSEPEIAFTMRRLSAPDVNLHNAALQALALRTSDQLTVGDVLELKFGSELQTIQFMGRVNAVKPFGSAGLHLSPNTVVQYKYASALPDGRVEKGFDTAPADLSESGPRMSMASFTPAVERAHHQEVSLAHRAGKTNLQAAFFSDRISDPALTGVGALSTENGEVLPDVYSGTFTYQGRDFDTSGMRLVVQRRLSSDVMATFDYAYGGVLELGRSDVELQDAREWLRNQRRHALAAKLSGTLPRAKTHWMASYRWVNGVALTPVDMFNASAGQADGYLNLFLRQPIPGAAFLPCKMEALVDIRNLLAQGYVPVAGQDGRTVYLVQSARSVRGGVAFTF